MTKPDNLPLYLSLYKFLKYLYLLIHNFPKEYKYTLGQSILNLSWKTLDLVILANILPNHKKGEKIRQISAVFDQLKTRLRMTHELKLFSDKKYAYIIEQNEEIGKMINGWLKWAQKQ
ncbi:four helix bundle protein [Patescibacteria group bacterium]|nr:four helix bundle protein [Patescibacteria group bacterium]